jgi:hypothetical protein
LISKSRPFTVPPPALGLELKNKIGDAKNLFSAQLSASLFLGRVCGTVRID